MVAMPVNIDMDVLRSFVTGFELGSFARAADRLGRSPSAISLQLRKLEDQVGQTLVAKQGRGLMLTEAGELMLGYARRILDLNDEARMALRGLNALEGWARVGLPQDFAETWLPDLLGRYSRAHPKVRVEARVDRGSELVEAVQRGELDFALTWGDLESAHSQVVARRPVFWIGASADFRRDAAEPLPMIAFDAPCAFRRVAVEALEDEGMAWRQVFASPSLAGLWAAVTAGLGVTPRTLEGKPPHLVTLDPKEAGLPPLGEVDLVIHAAKAKAEPHVAELRNLVLEAIAGR